MKISKGDKSMADLKVLFNQIMQKADIAPRDGEIKGEKEISIFSQEVKGLNLSAEEEGELYKMAGLDIGGAGRRRANGNGIYINVDASTNITINIKIDMKIEELIKDLIANFDAKIDEVIAEMAKNNQNIVQIVAALMESYKGDFDAIKKMLAQISGHVANSDATLTYMSDILRQILDKELDFYAKFENWDIRGLLNQIKDNQLKQIIHQEEQLEYLNLIYQAITKLGDDQQGNFNILMQKFEKGDVKFDEVLDILRAINADTSENNEISKQILAKSDEILQAIKDIGLDIKNIDENTKNILLQLLAQGESMDDIKELLKAMKEDIEAGNTISKETLEVVKKLGVDVAADLLKIYNKIPAGGGGGGGITPEQFEALLEAINRNTDAVNNNTDVSIQNKKDIIAAMADMGDKLTANIVAGVTTAIEKLGDKLGDKIDNLDLTVSEGITAILDKIDDMPDYSKVLNDILEALKKLAGDVNNNFATVITLIGQKPDINIQALLDKMDEIIKEIQDHDVHVTVDVTGKVECHCDCGGGGNNEGVEARERKLQDMLDEVFNGGEDPTKIKNTQQQQQAQKGIYDLAGRRYPDGTNFNQLPKGTYIVDGKKVIKQ